MIRLTKRIIGWLKTVFKGENMSFEFPTFKVAEIESAINIKDQATTDGKNDLPRTSSRTFSNCENEAITKTDELRNKEVKRAAEYLKPKKKQFRVVNLNLIKNLTILNNLKIQFKKH